MKRLFFVAAMLVASGTAVWAGNNMSSQATVVAAQDADFKPIDVKELPGAVAMSVEKYYPEAEIKEVQARAAAKAKAPMREINLDFAISTHFLSSFIIPRVVESP